MTACDNPTIARNKSGLIILAIKLLVTFLGRPYRGLLRVSWRRQRIHKSIVVVSLREASPDLREEFNKFIRSCKYRASTLWSARSSTI